MNLKSFSTMVFAVAALTVALFAPMPSSGQGAAEDDARLETLVKDVAAQQAVIIENQTKIDAKILSISEYVRLARIYAGRSR